MAKSKKKHNMKPRRSGTVGGMYKIHSDNELTAAEKEMFGEVEVIAEKVHYAGMAAALAFFDKLDFDEFKELFTLITEETVEPDAYAALIKIFYEAYCNGYASGDKFADQMFEDELKDKKIMPSVCKR